jgi:Cu2+-exporting ATPase
VAHAAPRGTASDVREELGRGISAVVEGRRVDVGSPTWIRARAGSRPVVEPRDATRGRGNSGALPRKRGRESPLSIEVWIAELAERGETPIVIAVDRVPVAVVGLADPIRDDASEAIAALRGLGWMIELLSGDDPRVVRRVGAALGVAAASCHGGVSPEAKVAAVTAARARGPVVMVGDGVNDAAAMAAATAGIAVSGAAEIAIDAADVYLRSPSITAIATTMAGARATVATIRRNLGFSLVYNVCAGLLAVTGVIHPLLAAIVMPLSSLTVLASSLRSRAFRGSDRGADRGER